MQTRLAPHKIHYIWRRGEHGMQKVPLGPEDYRKQRRIELRLARQEHV